MQKSMLLFVNPEFDQRFPCGISRLYRIFSKKYRYNFEIVDEAFLKGNIPAEKGSQILIIAGGDGTIHRAVNIIPDEALPKYIFGIIPAGTANEFAKSLKLPLYLEDAAEVIAQNKRKTTPKPGIINKKHKFMTGFLYGIACKVLSQTSPVAKHYLGNYAYQLPGLFSLLNYPDFVKKFTIDSKTFYTGYFLVNCASLLSTGLFSSELGDNENKSLFSVVYLEPEPTVGDFLRLMMENQAGGNILDDKSIFYTQMEDFTLRFNGELEFMLDGEIYRLNSPIEFEHSNFNLNVIF